MATTSNQLTAPYCSSNSSSSPPGWDVFLSFYGKDTRINFTSHLYFALDQAGIKTFMDDPELEKGEEISQGLLKAIHDSKMFVVVISENYARSSWCLDELVEILACKKTENQVVPVFYYVDPSDLRHQKGSFGKALDYHKKRYSVDMIDKWKYALIQIAELSGYHLKKNANKNESDTIQEIVKNIKPQASTITHLEEYLVGIDTAVEEIYQKLSMESNDVRAIGICGMGGIGKTTTAKAFYNKYSNKFDISCFIENEKQHSQGGSPLLPLLNQLLIELPGRKDSMVRNVESGIRQLKQILCSKKALIVLDDLHQSIFSEVLVRLHSLFSARSRIIITTRDANLLNQLKVDISEVDIYMVKELEHIDSLDLFSYHAFRKPTPPECFRELTESFVTYAGGLPLALKVLGSSLRGRTHVSFWKAKLEKVRKIPEKEIQKILQLTYDELDDETEKAIFLDIAFFFVGKDKDEAVHIFNSCDFFPDAGIPILVERCLLTIDYNNKFQMHNLIQDMGREVGKSRGLFWRGVPEDMQNLEGAYKIEGLILDLTMSVERQIAARIFEKFSKLRLLEIVGAEDIKGNFKNLFHELRYIRLRGCRCTYLSSSFLPQKLVSLDVSSSELKALWKSPTSIKLLTNLGHLHVSRCHNLKRLPEQLGDMKGLKFIDVSYTAIKKLPDSIAHLKELVELRLNSCKKLRKLPEQFGNMEGLKKFVASDSAIEQLPDSFGGLIKLVDLQLSSCQSLISLPNSLGKMQCLEELDASDTAIEELPDSIGLLSKLQVLSVDSLKYVPSSIWNLTSLTILDLHNSRIDLPDTVKNMKLEELNLRCNMRLWLPVILSFTSLKKLSLFDQGQSLSSTKPLSLSKLYNLETLILADCTSIGSCIPELPLDLRYLSLSNHTTLEQLPDLSSLKRLKFLYIERCISLQSLAPLPPHLEEVKVEECTSLQDVPDLSMLKELETLSFRQCSNLKLINMNESNLKVGSDKYSSFKADLPNREIAEWFSYKSSGCTVCLDIPVILGDNFLGVAVWVVYKCKNSDSVGQYTSCIRAVITNKTEGLTSIYNICPPTWIVGEVQSRIECMRGDEISVKSGDTIMVTIESLLYSNGETEDYDYPSGEVSENEDYDYPSGEVSESEGYKYPSGEVNVEMCGAHVMQKTISPRRGFKRYRSEDDPEGNPFKALIQDQVPLIPLGSMEEGGLDLTL